MPRRAEPACGWFPADDVGSVEVAALVAFAVSEWLTWAWQGLQLFAPPAVIVLGVGAIITFIVQTVAKSVIEGRVQRHFLKEMEELRAELRRSEEELRSALRAREAELSAIQGSILSSRTQRLALLDKRQIEAVEKIWVAVGGLGPIKSAAAILGAVKLSKIAEGSVDDPRLRQFVASFLPKTEDANLLARPWSEQPFVTPLAWAYFVAYQTICAYYFAIGKLIAGGFGDAANAVDGDAIRRIVRAALPDDGARIDTMNVSHFHFLLDTLEERLIGELRRNLHDPSVDEERARHAQRIMAAAAELDKQRAQAQATAAGA